MYRYILDNLGYIQEFGDDHIITCDNVNCVEYTGATPSGYDTIEEWVRTANIRAYRIVDDDLTFDSARDAALQAEWGNCGIAGETVLYNNSTGTNGNITLSETSENFKYIDIIGYDFCYRYYSPHNKVVTITTVVFDAADLTNVGIVNNYKRFSIYGTDITVNFTQRQYFYPSYTKPLTDFQNNIYVTRVVGYK